MATSGHSPRLRPKHGSFVKQRKTKASVFWIHGKLYTIVHQTSYKNYIKWLCCCSPFLNKRNQGNKILWSLSQDQFHVSACLVEALGFARLEPVVFTRTKIGWGCLGFWLVTFTHYCPNSKGEDSLCWYPHSMLVTHLLPIYPNILSFISPRKNIAFSLMVKSKNIAVGCITRSPCSLTFWLYSKKLAGYIMLYPHLIHIFVGLISPHQTGGVINHFHYKVKVRFYEL